MDIVTEIEALRSADRFSYDDAVDAVDGLLAEVKRLRRIVLEPCPIEGLAAWSALEGWVPVAELPF